MFLEELEVLDEFDEEVGRRPVLELEEEEVGRAPVILELELDEDVGRCELELDELVEGVDRADLAISAFDLADVGANDFAEEDDDAFRSLAAFFSASAASFFCRAARSRVDANTRRRKIDDFSWVLGEFYLQNTASN